jgi:isocitrate lyase
VVKDQSAKEGLKTMTRRITCITKHPTHEDRHRRIQAVGGSGWKDSEDTAIANVKRDSSAYEVTEQGKTVKVIVKTHDSREYLKTENDRFLPDNLLSLPEC